MKISELIALLHVMVEQHGDLEVMAVDFNDVLRYGLIPLTDHLIRVHPSTTKTNEMLVIG